MIIIKSAYMIPIRMIALEQIKTWGILLRKPAG